MNDDALIDELDVVRAQAEADKAKTEAVARVLGPGPVYQGVSKSIRVLTATGKYEGAREAKVDAEEMAGVIALARATARTVDKMTGHNVHGWHANGRDVAPVLEQLRELLQLLGGDLDETNDPLLEWLAADDAPTEATL